MNILKDSRLQGVLCALFAVSVWSGWTILSTYSVRSDLTTYDIAALRFGTAALFLTPVLLKKGFKIGPWGVWSGILLSLLLGVPYNLITVYAMKLAPASHAGGVLNISMLAFVALVGFFWLKEKTSWMKVTGIAISVGGVMLLLHASGQSAHPETVLQGDILFLAGGCLWATYTLLARRWKIDPFHAAASVVFWSALFYLPFYFLYIPSHISFETLPQAASQAIYQGIINSIGAQVCFNHAIRSLGASNASAFVPLIPILSTLLAIPFLGELPVMYEWIGIALGVLGVSLSSGMVENLRSSAKIPSPSPASSPLR